MPTDGAISQSAAASQGRDGNPFRVFIATVVGLCLVTTLVRLDARTLTSHEAYLSVTTREMLTTGDWVMPRFLGWPRLTKPPFGYWSAAVSCLACGGASEFAMRLPSALAGIGLAALVGLWASRMFGSRAGWTAVLIQTTSVAHALFAREATVDMQLALMVTLVLYLLAFEPSVESPLRHRLRWLGVWTLLGIMFLAKFHYGPVMAMGPAVIVWLWNRQPSRALGLVNPVGLLVFLGCCLVWPAVILYRDPNALNIWQYETVGRALGAMEHEPLWFFVPQALVMLLPWTPALLWAIPQSLLRLRAGSKQDRFLWAWFAVQFVIVSMSDNKHRNYLLPAMASLSVLVAPVVLNLFDYLRCSETRRQTWLSIGVGAGVLFTPIVATVLVAQRSQVPGLPLQTAGALAGVGGLAFIGLLHFRRIQSSALVLALTFAACHVIATGWIIPERDYRLPAAQFALEVRHELPDAPICLFRMGQSPVAFYLPGDTIREEEDLGLKKLLGRQPELHVVTDEVFLPIVRNMGVTRVVKTVNHAHPAASRLTPQLVLVEVRPCY